MICYNGKQVFKVKRECLQSEFCNPGEIIKRVESHTQFSCSLISKFYRHAPKPPGDLRQTAQTFLHGLEPVTDGSQSREQQWERNKRGISVCSKLVQGGNMRHRDTSFKCQALLFQEKLPRSLTS